jgi:hypothetical protein
MTVHAILFRRIMGSLTVHLLFDCLVADHTEIRALRQEERVLGRLMGAVAAGAFAVEYRSVATFGCREFVFNIVVTLHAQHRLRRREHSFVFAGMRGVAGQALTIFEGPVNTVALARLHELLVTLNA